jgi:hypothetical protein
MRVLGKEVIALGTAIPAIESAWSPKPGFHTLERDVQGEIRCRSQASRRGETLSSVAQV